MTIAVVIRADGGAEIGYGHLVRSNALAEELLTSGHTVTVATTTPNPARAVFLDTVDIVDLPSRDDPEPFVELLETATPDIVFTDSYTIDTAYQRTVREHLPLAVLQDDSRHAVCANLFINGNLYATDLEYEFVGQSPTTCLGSDYVLLRREIRERATEEPPWRDPPERAIVMMGGSDIAGLTPTIVRAFDGFDLHVDAVVGPGCSAELEQEVRRAATEGSAAVSVSRDPDDLVDRMFSADLAVSTAGSTTYELLALGTPIVSIPVVENQEPIAAALRSRDAANVLQRGSDQDAFRDAIEELTTEVEQRRNRRVRGRQLVDGKGSKRVVAELRATVGDHDQ